jgi:putative tryptophan/tyrosine transport system substrate-binding protein
MRRREFLSLFGGAGTALIWRPAVARAQQAGRLPVIGLVFAVVPSAEFDSPSPAFLPARAFLQRLRELGWIEGRTIIIERRSPEGRPERASAILAELIARGVDVIMVGATDWLQEAARQATRTIPIVAVFSEDPVAAGLIASLAHPGGNLTGVTTGTDGEMYEKRYQLLKELAPGSTRVGFLGRRSAWETYRRGAKAAAAAHVFAPVDRPEEFEEAFAILLRERVDSLLVSHGPVLNVSATRIAAFAKERRLPAMFPWREAVEAGGLMSYGPEVRAHFRQTAEYVDKILKGAKPADLPVEQPTKFEFVVNLKTAKAIGLEVPPLLIARTDELIE